jgi:diacylglycerol kinase (ATP)
VTRRMAEFDAVVEGRSERVGFALASRVKNYGGDLEIAKGACLLENEFELVLFRGSNPLRYLVYFAGVLVGGVQKISGATTERARKVEFAGTEDRRVYIQVDGEFAGHLPAKIEIIDDALTLLVPAGYREKVCVKIDQAFQPT